MDPTPIMPSATDLERRRLETTIDQDLHSLSLGSLITTTASSTSHSNRHSHSPSHSISSMSSIEIPRGFGEGDTGRGTSLMFPSYPADVHGPHGTPRAAVRKASGMSLRSEFDSPVSTAGHHVSAMTLNQGIFRRGREEDSMAGDEFDPERSLGRLVGELGKVMGNRISPRPTSPFAALSPPRSPSPFSIQQNAQNLSFTLNRNDPLPSPPHSRAGSRSASGSSADSVKITSKTGLASSRFSSIARELGNDIKTRQPLGESQRYNMQQPTVTPGAKRGTKEKDAGAPEKDRVRALQGERRTSSAPARAEGDLTGMTCLMATPAKGGEFDDVAKNGAGGNAGAGIPQALATLHARLRALETENSLSRRRVRDLESELERAKGEVETAKRSGASQLKEVIGEKTALEDLIKSLRNHLARLTAELEQNKALVTELRQVQAQPAHASPPRGESSVTKELVSLRKEVERLGAEVHRLGGIVEEGLDTRRRARGEKSVRMEQEEAERMAREFQEEDDITRIRKDMERRSKRAAPQQQGPPPTPGPSRLAQGLRAAAAQSQANIDPTMQPSRPARRPLPSHSAPPAFDTDERSCSPSPTTASVRSRSRRSQRDKAQREEGPGSPFPSIRAEDEGDFFAAAEKSLRNPSILARKISPLRIPSPLAAMQDKPAGPETANKATYPEPFPKNVYGQTDDLPPQTILARVIRELEADFAHYKSIYAELADQYRVLDAASAIAKRKVLAEHLKEVIDTLEQKADQISALYDLLTYQDRPAGDQGRPGKVHKSVPDILRMVKESLGEEGMKRLEEDGVGMRH